QRETKHQGFFGNVEEEYAVEVQQDARLVRSLERQRRQQNVGETKKDSRFPVLAAEHPDSE
ncbi:MAG TPA: hypothetical protein VNH83_31700, partial [Bryobacteraceae bacterium]|nr:hypothetical protein [Bryobacteraceae bacterium]